MTQAAAAKSSRRTKPITLMPAQLNLSELALNLCPRLALALGRIGGAGVWPDDTWRWVIRWQVPYFVSPFFLF